ESLERPFRRPQAEEIEQQSEILAIVQPELVQPRFQLGRDLAFGLARGEVKQSANHFDERTERGPPAVGRALSRENESMVFTDELEELVEQTRLSHPRLGRHVDHAQRLLRFIERALQDAEFALSSDKSAEASIDRRV